MTEERFSYVVERYYRERGTCPATLFFKNHQVDDEMLLELHDTATTTFENRDDIELLDSVIVEGDYWSGVLLEFNQSDFDGVDDSAGFSFDEETLYKKLAEIYDEYDENDTRITGLSKGRTVYSSSALQSLGRSFFKTADEVYRGPTI